MWYNRYRLIKYKGAIKISFEDLINTLKILSQGLGITLSLFFITIIVSLPLGFITTLCSQTKFRPIRWIARFYVFIMRGTPLMLQLLFVYFGLPYIPLIGQYLVMDRFTAACVAFILNYAAYFCEIFRGGIKSIDKGQYEAAQVLGLSKFSTLVKIVIPQMIKVALPSVCNESVSLVKDTALVTTIGLADLMHKTKGQVNALVNVTPFVIAAAIYLALIFILTKIFAAVEKKTNY